MAEYCGLGEICQRMGWKDLETTKRNLLTKAFPIFRRRRGSNPRLIYYTNDALITHWEWMMVRATRNRILDRRRGNPKKPTARTEG